MRLPHYDYATPGAYFVTICVENRACLFGEIVGGVMQLPSLGKLVDETWRSLPAHYSTITLDEFVVMPNHMHGVLTIREEGGRPLTEVMRAFKSFSAREINKSRTNDAKFAWQGGFHEHVVRDEKDLTAIREYIQNNPLKWELDEENPARRSGPKGGS